MVPAEGGRTPGSRNKDWLMVARCLQYWCEFDSYTEETWGHLVSKKRLCLNDLSLQISIIITYDKQSVTNLRSTG